ncbi:predicted protein [Micromonas commoda]|uniref:Centrosomal protein of 19 kDa n=1 Tax=Micromonas commoda (strain RCC299 / NOUM17 / CCMP2709) TaxID=296587 RepID=C1EFF4_MICCC|nr:predicted protein [Micromonas commoda]ACO67076.1 predicted protein [Micromonas commoda]|eukprot:XP_002505818.1 predicted protein [Micromonas commoda]
MEAPFQPRRFAVKFNPPRFLLEYSDGVKTRVRSVGIDVPEGMDVDTLATGVIDTFPRRLDRRKVRLSQVTRLVRRLVDHVRGIGDPADANGFGEDVDLNLVSPQALAAAKVRMDEGFRKTQKLPGDEGFVYDVRKEFNPTEPNDWDESDEDDGDGAMNADGIYGDDDDAHVDMLP